MDGNLRSLDDVATSLKHFGSADYAVFIAMLVCCSLIGLYFAWQNNRKTEQCGADNYLMGGRNMQVFPVGELLWGD